MPPLTHTVCFVNHEQVQLPFAIQPVDVMSNARSKKVPQRSESESEHETLLVAVAVAAAITITMLKGTTLIVILAEF